MYSTCLFCKASLGSNEVIESFPVGRRLAFDAAKGRLWVVCRKCQRWNLTPLEERWEAFEACERLFRETRARASTENVGLTRLREGLELVRIGKPLRPEFAAWRYGDQFGRRRRRAMLYGAGGAAVVAAVLAGQLAAVFSASLLTPSVHLFNWYAAHRSLFRFRMDDGQLLTIRAANLGGIRMVVPEDGGDWRMQVSGAGGDRTLLVGDEARRFAFAALPRLNGAGGSRAAVSQAVSEIESSGGPEGFLAAITARVAPRSGKLTGPITSRDDPRVISALVKPLASLPAPIRLAAEMALHEDQERRALEGELAILEAAWRDAEEVAVIADSLLVTPEIDASIERMRKTR